MDLHLLVGHPHLSRTASRVISSVMLRPSRTHLPETCPLAFVPEIVYVAFMLPTSKFFSVPVRFVLFSPGSPSSLFRLRENAVKLLPSADRVPVWLNVAIGHTPNAHTHHSPCSLYCCEFDGSGEIV